MKFLKRRDVVIAIVILLITSTLSLDALPPKDIKHRICFGLEGGLSHLFLGQDIMPFRNYSKPFWGGFGGAEVVYELEYRKFLFRTGLGIDHSLSWNLYQPPEQSRSIAEYPTLQYHYRFSNFKEKTSISSLYLPLLIGAEYEHLYFLAGTKVCFLPFSSTVQSYVDAYVWGTDDDVINPMEGLYTHYMGDYSIVGEKQSISLNPINVTASFEVGICLGKPVNAKQRRTSQKRGQENYRKKGFAFFKIAIVADYGLTDMFTYKPNPAEFYTDAGIYPEGGLISIPEVSRIVPYSLTGYEPHRDAVLHNFYMGFRFSILYQYPRRRAKNQCKWCKY